MLKELLHHHQPTNGDVGRLRPTFTTSTITLAPGEVGSIGLGVYDNQAPTPQFDYTCRPAMEDSIGAKLDRLDFTSKPAYMLLYQFHNYGDKECRIEVVRLNQAELAPEPQPDKES